MRLYSEAAGEEFMSGLFISFEGNDGAGKSTQVEKLAAHLRKSGFTVQTMRDPGGTDISEKIREIILDNSNYKMKHMTEALLYASSRCQLVYEKIMPALRAGQVVICDRFVDSSLVYQGIARGLGIDVIKEINKFATGGLEPDITFFLHLDPAEGIKRKQSQGSLDRMENEKSYFHNKVYQGFEEISQLYPMRIVRIEAKASAKKIAERIAYYIDTYINERGI